MSLLWSESSFESEDDVSIITDRMIPRRERAHIVASNFGVWEDDMTDEDG